MTKDEHIKSNDEKEKASVGQPTKVDVDFVVKYFNLIFVVVIVFSLGLSGILFVKPLIKGGGEYSVNDVKNKRQDLKVQQRKLDELIKLGNLYDGLDVSLKQKVYEILPDQPELPNIYYTLEQIADEANYKLNKVVVTVTEDKIIVNKKKPAAEEAGQEKSLKEVKINVGLEGGGYSNLKNIVRLLEKNLRIFDIETFTYAVEQTDMEMVLKTYYYSY